MLKNKIKLLEIGGVVLGYKTKSSLDSDNIYMFSIQQTIHFIT